jgi:hypothetical protein
MISIAIGTASIVAICIGAVFVALLASECAVVLVNKFPDWKKKK